MTLEQAEEVREVRRPDQRVEREVQRRHRPEPGSERGAEHPVHVGNVVEHGPEAPQARIGGEIGHDVGGARRVERRPSDDTGDEGGIRGAIEQKASLRHGRRSLDEHGHVDAGVTE